MSQKELIGEGKAPYALTVVVFWHTEREVSHIFVGLKFLCTMQDWGLAHKTIDAFCEYG
jgi:hypothetical protein